MPNMYRVFAFWTTVIALMAYIGHMPGMALLFAAQTAIFLALSYLNLTERVYIYIFACYLVVAFVGFTYYSTFLM